MANKYLTEDRIIHDASQYKTRLEWLMASPGMYAAAIKKGWFDKATAHMTSMFSRTPECY